MNPVDRFDDAGVPSRAGAHEREDTGQPAVHPAPKNRTDAWALDALWECRSGLGRVPSIAEYDEWQRDRARAAAREDKPGDASPTSLVLLLLYETATEPWAAATAAAEQGRAHDQPEHRVEAS